MLVRPPRGPARTAVDRAERERSHRPGSQPIRRGPANRRPFLMAKNEVVLRVAEAIQEDVAKGRVRLDSQTRLELELTVGDVVEIEGKKTTAAIVWRAPPEDEGKGLIRMDGLIPVSYTHLTLPTNREV